VNIPEAKKVYQGRRRPFLGMPQHVSRETKER
jgi:hypothetical protein